jgi:hypothetical protein
MADAPNCGAEKKIGHSGRDDKTRKRKTQEHSQEWLCRRMLAELKIGHCTL